MRVKSFMLVKIIASYATVADGGDGDDDDDADCGGADAGIEALA